MAQLTITGVSIQPDFSVQVDYNTDFGNPSGRNFPNRDALAQYVQGIDEETLFKYALLRGLKLDVDITDPTKWSNITITQNADEINGLVKSNK